VGAFTTTDLDRQLRDRAITTLVLAGISTSGVVLSTVREAMDCDYRIVVLEDATADSDPDTQPSSPPRSSPDTQQSSPPTTCVKSGHGKRATAQAV
jgi:hypothetical protein